MSRTFDFSYEGLTRDAPYEAIFVDYMHSDFNFTVKRTENNHSITCCFREFTLDEKTLILQKTERTLTEQERGLTLIFIREKDEYIKSNEFKAVMDEYQVDLEKKIKEDQAKMLLGGTSPALFLSVTESNKSKNTDETSLSKTI